MKNHGTALTSQDFRQFLPGDYSPGFNPPAKKILRLTAKISVVIKDCLPALRTFEPGILRLRQIENKLCLVRRDFQPCVKFSFYAVESHDAAIPGQNFSDFIFRNLRTGTPLNADVSREMLGTIFYEGTPLHDGAVVIVDGELKAAGCVLPLSNNLEMGKDMGTRHRAALGMSENSDAVVVVVSEETGIISLAKDGIIMRRLDRQNLFHRLQETVIPPEEETSRRRKWGWK